MTSFLLILLAIFRMSKPSQFIDIFESLTVNPERKEAILDANDEVAVEREISFSLLKEPTEKSSF